MAMIYDVSCFTMNCIAQMCGYRGAELRDNRLQENLDALRRAGYNPKIGKEVVRVGTIRLPKAMLETEPFSIILRSLEERRK